MYWRKALNSLTDGDGEMVTRPLEDDVLRGESESGYNVSSYDGLEVDEQGEEDAEVRERVGHMAPSSSEAGGDFTAPSSFRAAGAGDYGGFLEVAAGGVQDAVNRMTSYASSLWETAGVDEALSGAYDDDHHHQVASHQHVKRQHSPEGSVTEDAEALDIDTETSELAAEISGIDADVSEMDLSGRSSDESPQWSDPDFGRDWEDGDAGPENGGDHRVVLELMRSARDKLSRLIREAADSQLA